MSILSYQVLNPTTHQIKNPFVAIITEMEASLRISQPEYFTTTWVQVKYSFLQRLLRLSKNGSRLRAFATTAPNDAVGTAILDIYYLLDHSVYFTSKYWRAFFYWLKTNQINRSCWSQFGIEEAKLALAILTEEDIKKLKIEANKEWLDFLADDEEVQKLFYKLTNPIKNLCYKRVSFLAKYDPAMYSYEDLSQYVFEKILVSLRNNDYISSSPTKMMSWALRCADNAIHNLRDKALAGKRNCKMLDSFMVDPRDLHIDSKKGFNLEESEVVEDVIENIGVDSFEAEMENDLCLQSLLKVATPKITSYLRTLCGEVHNSNFWTWFYYNEPELAKKPAYIAENPEAIGPYLQQHLNLSTYQLTCFLKQHLPSILTQVQSASNNTILKYVVGEFR